MTRMIRFAKAMLTLSLGMTATIIVLNNIVDYNTGHKFTKHVLSMDDVYPDSRLKRRAVTSPGLHHAVYILITLWEAAVAVLCTWGGTGMLRVVSGKKKAFRKAKQPAVSGLLAVLLWFGAFRGIARQWFAMWQSKKWNGLPVAARLTQFASTLLIFVTIDND
jgi:predicted small integral membrane protein